MSGEGKRPLVKATTYKQKRGLVALRPEQLDLLDFTGFIEVHGIEVLDELFPKVNKKGNIDPPPYYLTSGAKVREWRRLSKGEQRREIENHVEGPKKIAARESRSRSRSERRQRRGMIITPATGSTVSSTMSSASTASVSAVSSAADDVAHINRVAMATDSTSATPTSTTLRATLESTVEEVMPITTSSTTVAAAVAAHAPTTAASLTTAPASTSATSTAAAAVSSASNKRVSFTIEYNNNNDDDPMDLDYDDNPAAEPHVDVADPASESPPGRPATSLTEPPPTQHKRNLHEDLEKCCSECSGITKRIILNSHCKDKAALMQGFNHLVGNAFREKGHHISNTGEWNYGDSTVGFLMDNNIRTDGTNYSWKCKQADTNQWEFHRNNCDNSTSQHKQCCYNCWYNRHKFYDMCRGEVLLREQKEMGGKAMQGRRDQMKFKSPSIVLPRLEEMSEQIKVLQRRNYRLEEVVKMMKKNTMEITNINEELFFDPKEIKRLYEELKSKEEVTQREIFDYLFEECLAVGKRIKRDGDARGHRYSALMIQFGCMLRKRCSVDMYDFFRKAFNLPPNQTLCEYANADSTSPDGLMMQTIIQMADIFDGNDIPRGDFRRYVNLGWDSHKVRGMLGKYHHILFMFDIC